VICTLLLCGVQVAVSVLNILGMHPELALMAYELPKIEEQLHRPM
jgi:hypothetical protein